MVEEVKDPQVELDVTKRDDHRVGKETTNPSGVEKRPLILIGHAFSRLLAEKESKDVDLGTSHFADACDHISVLFQMLGVAFAFGGRDFIEKVDSALVTPITLQTSCFLLFHLGQRSERGFRKIPDSPGSCR